MRALQADAWHPQASLIGLLLLHVGGWLVLGLEHERLVLIPRRCDGERAEWLSQV